jgi:hypothetical protein
VVLKIQQSTITSGHLGQILNFTASTNRCTLNSLLTGTIIFLFFRIYIFAARCHALHTPRKRKANASLAKVGNAASLTKNATTWLVTTLVLERSYIVEIKGRPPETCDCDEKCNNNKQMDAELSNSILNPRFPKIEKVKMPSFLGRDGMTHLLNWLKGHILRKRQQLQS